MTRSATPPTTQITPDVLLLIVIGAGLGWAWLALQILAMTATTDFATLGPGMAVFNRFTQWADVPEAVRASLVALCMPTIDHAWTLADWSNTFMMWMAMVLAMMLPIAAPALTTARSAARGPRMMLAPLVIGYLAAWTGFALIATALQGGLAALRYLHSAMAPMTDELAAMTMLAAAVYQFTPWKSACLDRCRHPAMLFPSSVATVTNAGMTGVRLGLDCLGCCWALMTVMFAVGVMNVIWIAALGAVMSIEKLATDRWPSWIIGGMLATVAAIIIVQSPAGQRLLSLI